MYTFAPAISFTRFSEICSNPDRARCCRFLRLPTSRRSWSAPALWRFRNTVASAASSTPSDFRLYAAKTQPVPPPIRKSVRTRLPLALLKMECYRKRIPMVCGHCALVCVNAAATPFVPSSSLPKASGLRCYSVCPEPANFFGRAGVLARSNSRVPLSPDS